MKKNKGIIHDVAMLLTAVAISKILGAVLKIPLANILGGTGMGYFSTAYSLFTPFLALTAVALPIIITKLVAQNTVKGYFRNARKLFKTALVISFVLGIIGTVTVILSAFPFVKYIVHSTESLMSIFLIAPSIFFCCIASVYRGYYEGLHDMFPTAVSQVVESFIRAALGLVFAYLALDGATLYFGNPEQAIPFAAAGAVFGITLSEVAGMISLVIIHKVRGDGITKAEIEASPKAEKGRKLAKQIITQCIPIAIGAVVINISSLIDMFTINSCIKWSVVHNYSYYLNNFFYGATNGVPLDELGNFVYGSYNGIVLTIFMLIPSIAGLISKSTLPNIASSWEEKNFSALARNIRLLYKGTLIMGLPLCFGLAAVAEPLMKVLYSSRVSEVNVSLFSLEIYGIFGITISIAGMLFSVFQAIGRSDIPIKLMIISLIVKFVCNIFLIVIPEINIAGAAISSISSYFVICIFGMIMLKKMVKFKIGFKNTFVKPFIASALCGTTAYLCNNFLFNEQSLFINLVISIGAGATVFVIINTIFNRKAIKNRFFSKNYCKSLKNSVK